jgi:hypothetical protein
LDEYRHLTDLATTWSDTPIEIRLTVETQAIRAAIGQNAGIRAGLGACPITAHASKTCPLRDMSSLEQYFDRNERLHSVIIPDRSLFAPELSTLPGSRIVI